MDVKAQQTEKESICRNSIMPWMVIVVLCPNPVWVRDLIIPSIRLLTASIFHSEDTLFLGGYPNNPWALHGRGRTFSIVTQGENGPGYQTLSVGGSGFLG